MELAHCSKPRTTLAYERERDDGFETSSHVEGARQLRETGLNSGIHLGDGVDCDEVGSSSTPDAGSTRQG